MPRGISKNGTNKGWFKKGIHPKTEFKKGIHSFPKGEFKKGQVSPRKGISLKEYPHIGFQKGNKNPMYGKGGSKHFNWKGGITPINIKVRTSLEYKLWRKAVFERDNYTCQKYGIKGGQLVAHHINNFSEKKELRFAIDNGITLSDKAHKELHKKHGKKNNTKEQLEDFLSNNLKL